MWESLGKLVPKKTISKLYDDMFSGAARELGKIGTDVAKTARLILAPLQITATFQDRFEGMLKRVQERIPANRQIEPPAELVGPILNSMRYLNDSTELWSMFEEVLTKAVDNEQNMTIHPSFPHTIAQLSRDEAWILYRLRGRSFKVVDTLDLNRTENRFENRVVIESELPQDELHLPDKINLFYSHLESLNLVTWPVEKQDPILSEDVQIGIRRHSTMKLTEFGQLFVSACIPERGFEKYARR